MTGFPSFVADLPLTREALEFASTRHAGQRREADDAPFILHPLEVAQLLRGRDYPDHVVPPAFSTTSWKTPTSRSTSSNAGSARP